MKGLTWNKEKDKMIQYAAEFMLISEKQIN